MTLVDWHNHEKDKIIISRHTRKLTCLYLVNNCFYMFLNVNVDTHILMTISLLPLKLVKIWLYRIISTVLYLLSD